MPSARRWNAFDPPAPFWGNYIAIFSKKMIFCQIFLGGPYLRMSLIKCLKGHKSLRVLYSGVFQKCLLGLQVCLGKEDGQMVMSYYFETLCCLISNTKPFDKWSISKQERITVKICRLRQTGLSFSAGSNFKPSLDQTQQLKLELGPVLVYILRRSNYPLC